MFEPACPPARLLARLSVRHHEQAVLLLLIWVLSSMFRWFRAELLAGAKGKYTCRSGSDVLGDVLGDMLERGRCWDGSSIPAESCQQPTSQ